MSQAEWWYGVSGALRAKRGGRTLRSGWPTAKDFRISPNSFVYDDIQSYPLDPNGAARVAHLASNIRDRYSTYGSIATTDYGLPFFVAKPSDPRITFTWGRKTPYPEGAGLGYYDGPKIMENVPWPEGATPATGVDSSISIWDPAGDKLWEFWHVFPNGQGGWKADNGGRIDNVSQWDGIYPAHNGMEIHGVSAAGLGWTPMNVKGEDVERAIANGTGLPYAIYLALPFQALAKLGENEWAMSWPARRIEGQGTASPELGLAMGQRLRFPANAPIESWNCHPVAKVIARTIRDHGGIVADGAGNWTIGCDADPRWPGLLNGTPGYRVFAGVPWEQLEAVVVDAGKP